MLEQLKAALWRQAGASADMIGNAIDHCSDEVWTGTNIWYLVYHTLFFLDYYLDRHPDEFHPPKPFTLSEFEPGGAMPERIYSRQELKDYLLFCRRKCQYLIASLDEESLRERFVNAYRVYDRLEIILYNMRHVQHHAGQIHMLLRQTMDSTPGWIPVAR